MAITLNFTGYRSRLTANTTFYVATTGSDSTGDGSQSSPWATLQFAYNKLSGDFDLNGKIATIQCVTGNYAALNTRDSSPNGKVILKGGITASDVIISGADALEGLGCLVVYNNPYGLYLDHIGFKNTGNFLTCLFLQQGANVTLLGDLYFTATTANTYGIACFSGSSFNSDFASTINVTVATSMWIFFQAANSSNADFEPENLIIVGTPAWGASCVTGSGASNVWFFPYGSITGSATGKRYNAIDNGVVSTFGSGATFIPGDVAGTTSTGGQYT